jgi:hypothetical protein
MRAGRMAGQATPTVLTVLLERAPRLNVDLTGLHAVCDQFPARRLDICHDDLDAFLRARRHLGDAGSHHD